MLDFTGDSLQGGLQKGIAGKEQDEQNEAKLFTLWVISKDLGNFTQSVRAEPLLPKCPLNYNHFTLGL
jgi:hypothetical protein